MILNYLNHAPIDFYFAKNARNFVVEEIPLYPFSGSGEHLILKIRKKNLSTPQMLNIISEICGLKRNEIGYAGLKDKEGMTIQHISIHKKFAQNIDKIQSENLKILESTYHSNKLKLGHLKGNKFFIRLKKLNATNARKLKGVCDIVAQSGIPNYFGYQRFGKNGDNFSEGRAILEGRLKIRDKKTAKFLISAYQSHLFNAWLRRRVEMSKIISDFSPSEVNAYLGLESKMISGLKSQKNFFKILSGDVMRHYPDGGLFYSDEIRENALDRAEQSMKSQNPLAMSAERFYQKMIAPSGLLYGAKAKRAKGFAGEIEAEFIDKLLEKEIGDRRFAWVFVENLDFVYKSEIATGELNFTLPKGSYATIALEILSNNPKDSRGECP